MDRHELLHSTSTLLEQLSAFQSAAEATLLFASSALITPLPIPPKLFPCPIDPSHRVPAGSLAGHTASCQAARGGYELAELPAPASSFFYGDAPGVVQLRRLPVDQPPRPPLPPQPGQHDEQRNEASSGTLSQTKALQTAIRVWEQTGGATVSHRLAAEQEVLNWRELPSPLPSEAGRLIAASSLADLANLVQSGAAESGVGLSQEEAKALGTLLTWRAQEAIGPGGEKDKEDRSSQVLTAVALLRPPAGAAPFLLRLWQTVLGGLLRTLPPLEPSPRFVSTAQKLSALEALRDAVRVRQQREQAGRPAPTRAELLARYEAGVQTATAVRARRRDYRPLPDHDWLFRPHDPSQPQVEGGRRSRVELLAELRDLKRRTTSYRAKKQRTPLQSARDLIELRMMQLEEAFGPVEGRKPAEIHISNEREGGLERKGEDRGTGFQQRRRTDERDARRKSERDYGEERRGYYEDRDRRGRWGDDCRGGVNAERRREDEGGPERNGRQLDRARESWTRYSSRDSGRNERSEERNKAPGSRSDRYEGRSDRREERTFERRDGREPDERAPGRSKRSRTRDTEGSESRWDDGFIIGGVNRWADEVEEGEAGRWGDEEEHRASKDRRRR